MARYLLPSTTTTTTFSSLRSPRDGRTSPAPILVLRGFASRSKQARPIMAVASEKPTAPSKFPKVAAPMTGPIPADELLGVIQAAAKAGAEVVMEAVNKPRNIQYKGTADLVTDTDKLSESVILEVVTKNFKDHLILGEEGGIIGDSLSEYLWCIDPLDGTTNFAHGYPSFSVSIGVLFRGKPAAATVAMVLIVMGKRFMSVQRTSFFPGVRRLGSAAADMSHVGLGITEAYWEYRLKPWDMAAGVLIVEEAGGVVSRMDGREYTVFDRSVLVSNGAVHEQVEDRVTVVLSSGRRAKMANLCLRKHPARNFPARRRAGAMRGRGWKYGSGFVDGVFPVLSPMAQDILELVQKGTDVAKVWESLDSIPATHNLWDDILNVAVQLRLNRQWDPIITVCEWIVYRSSFRPDVICYNLLIDAYGRKRQLDKAEAMYTALLEARCVPTEDTYALLLRAYCNVGSLHRAEGVISEMREHGIPPSATVYNAYLDGLLKARCTEKAVEVYQRMKRDRCRTNTETYTLMINVYGKSKQPMSAMKVFNEMQSIGCKANICTYTALVNAFAREGLCEKAEEVFEEMQQAGHEPDVYAYNALMEAYSRAGFPQGASEIFTLMQHMGCEPDRASYNILVDAYGRAGRHREAEAVFESLKQQGMAPTMKSHMLLLSAHARSGNVARCQEVMAQLHKSGLTPDTFALNAMLNAYGRAGRLDDMERLLAAMEHQGSCDVSTYNVVVNAYGRAGYLERMEAAFAAMKGKRGIAADVVTWTSRMGAYARKKEYRRCLEIFEEMVDAGCYPDAGTAKVLVAACSDERQVEQVTAIVRSMHKEAKTLFTI
ncbi:hypothetical protein ACQ4PT_033436 [Festuca glaucescens]